MLQGFPFVLLEAAEAAPTELGPYALYMGWGWILLLFFCACIWLYMTSWVCRDAIGIGLKYPKWTSLMLAAGGAPFILVVLVHAALGFLMLIAVGFVFAMYVRERNQVVPELYRIFDRAYLNRILVRLKLRKADYAAVPGKSGHAASGHKISIRLLNKDGVHLDTLVTAAPNFAPAAPLTGELIDQAVLSRATALQFEPRPAEYAVRMKIDGVMHLLPSYDRETGRGVLGVIALLSGITSPEGKQLGSKGAFTVVEESGNRIEVQVNAIKTATAPTLALTFPDPTANLYKSRLEKLGMLSSMLPRVRELVQNTHAGLILFSGPADSGKTTTLYGALGELDVFLNTIITIEDTIEGELDHVTRYALNPAKGETLEAVLKRALREDPTVLLFGDLRDRTTASEAVALARDKLVMACLQADDATGAVMKLLSLVPGPETGKVLTAVLAQRLIRLLCPACKVPIEPPMGLLAKLKIDPANAGQWFDAVGCDQCASIGYRGRTGLFELLIVSPDMRKVLMAPKPPQEQALRTLARAAGMASLQEDGLKKVMVGATTLKEVYRVTTGKAKA